MRIGARICGASGLLLAVRFITIQTQYLRQVVAIAVVSDRRQGCASWRARKLQEEPQLIKIADQFVGDRGAHGVSQ